MTSCGARSRRRHHLRLPVCRDRVLKPQPDISLSTAATRAELEEIQDEWLDLYRAGDEQSFCLDPIWCLMMVARLDDAPDRRPTVIVGRLHGRIRLVWPLVSFRSRLWRVTRGLSENLADHDDMLVADAPEADGWRRQAWRFAVATLKPDMMLFRRIPEGSGLDRLIGDDMLTWQRPTISLCLDFRDEDAWDASYRMLSPKTRASLRRSRKWLSRLGEVRTRAIADEAAAFDLIDWAHARMHERLAAHAHNRREKTEHAAFGRDLPFFLDVARYAFRAGRLAVLRLSAGDRTVAVNLVLTDGRRAVGWLYGFDADFLPASPGNLLLTESFTWAQRRGFEIFDLAPEPDPYKRKWTTRGYNVRDVRVAVTGWGKVLVTWNRSSLRTSALELYMRLPRPLQLLIRRLSR